MTHTTKRYFYHHVCHLCKMYTENIKTCSNCKLVFYCSVNHQKVDWRNHKKLCKCVHLIMNERNVSHLFQSPVSSQAEWISRRMSWMSLIECFLKRSLKLDEMQMILFPNVCGVCFVFCPSRIYDCRECCIVNYCSREHKEDNYLKHLQECDLLKLSFSIENVCNDIALNASDALNEIMKLRFQDISLDTDTETFIKTHIPLRSNSVVFKNVNLSDIQCISILGEILSGCLTILSSLYISKTKCLNNRSSLKIHVIGAGEHELSCLLYSFELFFHLLPSLCNLLIVFVGPEIYKDEYFPKLCENCKNKKNLIIEMEKALYHVLVLKNDYEKPDLIVALNSGFHEYNGSVQDTWVDTVKVLLNINNVILVFTSYSKEEAELDFSLVTKNKDLDKVKIHQKQEMNKFRSLRPVRDWEALSSSIFYPNYYISSIETFNTDGK